MTAGVRKRYCIVLRLRSAVSNSAPRGCGEKSPAFKSDPPHTPADRQKEWRKSGISTAQEPAESPKGSNAGKTGV